ncbi:MAG: dihydrolipoamide acetyltransferase family protein [Candidatus Korarchaeota archaeon]|nr:dihydrolipoamide acetyltransferase family protein [Candidatus Korarchaeota archaeon]
MPWKVVMPRLDPGMKTGKLIRWLKKEGELVKKGEEIATAEGEKTTFPIESPADGVLAKILVQEGEEVPVLTTLAIVAALGEEISEEEFEREAPREAVEVRASPAARRLAKDYGIDLRKVRGTGPGGRITKEDVLRYVESAGLRAEPGEEGPRVLKEIELTGKRGTIARRLTESHREIPSVTIVMRADMSRALELRRREAAEGRKFSITALVVKAAAKALEEHRELNSSVVGDKIIVYDEINVGVAVSVPDGLVVPVIRDANKKDVMQITRKIEELASKARSEEGLSPEDVSGGTFTVSNLGAEGVEIFTPIINPPQSAILGVGAIVPTPVGGETGIELRPQMALCLVFDHRVVDGVPAARFLRRVVELLENPEGLI